MNKYKAHKRFLMDRCLQRGYSIEEVMPCVVEKLKDDIWVIDVDHRSYPKLPRDNFASLEYKNTKVNSPDIGEGVGTELKKLLSWMNIQATPNCTCNQKAKFMNNKGIEWCKENVDSICIWLQEEAVKRKLPFFNYGAKKLIKFAISRAERKQK
jgi:hypothetical protein